MIDKQKINFQKENVIVCYANELARTSNQFTLEEEKVLHLIFSKIKPYEKNNIKFRIDKTDFFDKLSLVGDSKYKRYEKIITNLISKTLTKIEKKETESKLIGVIIINSEWFYKKPYFEVSLNPNFMPYLEQLINHYTKVGLESVIKLKSKHALTIYKFLCSWNDEKKLINQRYLKTMELKELLGLSIDDYMEKGNFNRANFERYTIKKAILEINEKTNINVSFKKRKKNNRVEDYEFTWNQKEKEKPSSQKHLKQVTNSDLQKEKLLINTMTKAEIKQFLEEFDNS